MKKQLKILLIIIPALLIQMLPGMSFGQGLVINNGYIVMNGGSLSKPIYLVVNSPNATGIKKKTNEVSWIISEADGNFVKWETSTSLSNAQYNIPFGYSTTSYIPFSFRAINSSGTLTDITVATWHTNADNTPYPVDVDPALADPYGTNYVNDIIDRFWRVRFTGTTGNGLPPQVTNMIFTYRGVENTLAPSPYDNLKPVEWIPASSSWSPKYGSGSFPGITDPDPNTANSWTQATPTSSIDKNSEIWVLVRYNAPLPIELVSLTAQCDNGNIDIAWATASETDNAYFSIQRSLDGTDFTDLGTVNGAGNSNSLLTYRFVDVHPADGIAYYRIKQTDYNGAHSYSKIIQAGNCNSNETTTDFFTYFDPNNHTVTIVVSGYEGPAKVLLRDMLGRQMISRQVDEIGSLSLSTGGLATGIYFVVMQTNTKTITKKIYIYK